MIERQAKFFHIGKSKFSEDLPIWRWGGVTGNLGGILLIFFRKLNGSVLSSKRKMLIPAKILCPSQTIPPTSPAHQSGSLRCPLEWKILCGAKSITGLPHIETLNKAKKDLTPFSRMSSSLFFLLSVLSPLYNTHSKINGWTPSTRLSSTTFYPKWPPTSREG